ncbi:23S rRNA (guanosine(2251)-2'-O)-methyltransferase RlmB [Rhodoligotrophos defluvii]|uniref:23S rRNA (guanosine(2251)-2'-O)-methyltransferase RlmB n=1 Tax=Rhodoligotrophos defluvii TaxID=2561934 RepID=UPI001EF0B44C|nr:23S rRNA (guanosine(2251)-2'-O)-methyltransferase RlmB [Rhodoligotrophos defluvii]
MSRFRRQGSPSERAAARGQDTRPQELIYGRHAVEAALKNPRRRLAKLWASQNALQRLPAALPEGLAVEVVPPQALDRITGPDAVHQGLVLEALPLAPLPLEDIPAEGVILVLDQVTDPHNVGAVIRLAAAFGAHALVTTERHGPGMTAALAKAASGGLEHVAIVRETNLARALDALKRKGFTAIGLDSEAEGDLESAPLRPPLALVLGAEGKGLRRLTRERCDLLAKIPLPGRIISLNVSTAAAIALYIVSRSARAKAPGGSDCDLTLQGCLRD